MHNPSHSLTAKSKALLVHLKQSLQLHHLPLDTAIAGIFHGPKQHLTRKQFHKLIKTYDQHLIHSQIDELFDDFVSDGGSFIDCGRLCGVMGGLPGDGKEGREGEGKREGEGDGVGEMREGLLSIEGYLDTVQLFVTEKDGFMNRGNVLQLAVNLGLTDEAKHAKLIAAIFEGKTKIQLKQFLRKLGLQNDGTRINLSECTLEESIILPMQRSDFIRQQQRQSRLSRSICLEYSKILDALQQMSVQNSQNSSAYSIEEIPDVLQPYFNYGSELEQPFGSLACKFLTNKLIYIDEEGPTYGKAARWVHIAEIKPKYFLFQAAESIIHRARQRKGLGMLLQPKDITQGRFGNCYFLSAIAAIVQYYPQLVYRLFVLEKNPSHIYGVKLFVDGIWKTIAVDGCFPMQSTGRFCGAQPHHDEIWVMLLEKAWAKLFKSYEGIHSGYNEEGLVAITGAPIEIVLVKQAGFLEKLVQEFKRGSIITCTTSKAVSEISEQEQQKLGVFAGHAYTILRVYHFQVNNRPINLIKMKNPWGTKAWKGDWSFTSPLWTQKLRNQLNYNMDSQDGTFFIELLDFSKYFDHINISKLNLGYRNSYVINHANRYEFYTNKVTIKQGGNYFFTLYQENGRKYRNGSGVYQRSRSWLFLARILQADQNSKPVALQALKLNASGYQNSTVQAQLEPGTYLLISKVNWNYWQQHAYTISSYGPHRVHFQSPQPCPHQLLLQLLISRTTQLINKCPQLLLPYNTIPNIWKSFYFEHTQGIGFISVGNSSQNRIIQSTFTLQLCRGVEVLAPFGNPVVMRVAPGEMVTAVCLVDPQGFSYRLLEGYKLYAIESVATAAKTGTTATNTASQTVTNTK